MKTEQISKYRDLRINQPQLQVKDNATEVIFKTISVMCDNVHYIRFRINDRGTFSMSGMGFSLSNWQMKHPTHEIEWMADEGNWVEVMRMINTGTSAIESVKSR